MTPELHGKRSLANVSLGISISQSDDLEDLGLVDDDVNRVVRDIATAVIGQGGSTVFGHDWRDGGVMTEIFEMAIHYKSSNISKGEGKPLIHNFVAAPDRSRISDEDRRRYADILKITESPEPPPLTTRTDEHSLNLVQRVHSLTAMRKLLIKNSTARICLGGRISGSSGICAGVIEEAVLSIKSGQPLYITGMLGGASEEFIRALREESDYNERAFMPREDVADALKKSAKKSLSKGVDPKVVAKLGVEGLAQVNRLSAEENEKLFSATQVSEVIGWVLVGLGRLQNSDNAQIPKTRKR